MFTTSCIQICSNNNIKENIKKILHYIEICIKEKTDFILTPENCSIMTNDKKELSEHLMLLDLGRNDAGKVSKINTVKVTEKFKIEKYVFI